MKTSIHMRTIIHTAVIVVASLALFACNTTATRSAETTDTVAPERDAAMLGNIKTLEGTWTMLDENGETVTAAIFKTTAAGSAVQEVMFPNEPHEMVNLYHMDGSDLVITHYCASGNQPRMVAAASETLADGSTVYRFNFDSISNLRPEHDHYMGSLMLTLSGNRLTETWRSYDRDGELGEPLDFEMTRK
jgi:hypothetical protein